MPTNKSKKISIQHHIANVLIEPNSATEVKILKKLIEGALDTYQREQVIDTEFIHEEMRKKHGAYYRTPGYMVWIYRRGRTRLTQAAFAKKLKIKQHHISEIEHNKRPVGKELAKKMAKLFKCDYRKFL